MNNITYVITTVNMRVLWNEQKGEHFNLKKVMRQGDPISPYIFMFCIDKISHMIMDVVGKKDCEGKKAGKRGPRISHLIFVNDLILFGKAIVHQVACIMKVLKNFCEASYQRVSIEKSNIMFSKNTPQQLRRQIMQA